MCPCFKLQALNDEMRATAEILLRLNTEGKVYDFKWVFQIL
jgi:hypothetical protein